jgi:pimeloyl-ACP methyl ester carboxylesterase
MYEMLARALSETGYSCFRYDRRGVGDSSGEDPRFRGSGPDLKAAAEAFRKEVPGLTRIIGFGLCDGASAIALYGGEAGLDGLILANPWLVETDEGAPAPAAIRAHYRKRLLSWEGWKRLLTGAVNFRKLWAGIRRLFHAASPKACPTTWPRLCFATGCRPRPSSAPATTPRSRPTPRSAPGPMPG